MCLSQIRDEVSYLFIYQYRWRFWWCIDQHSCCQLLVKKKKTNTCVTSFSDIFFNRTKERWWICAATGWWSSWHERRARPLLVHSREREMRHRPCDFWRWSRDLLKRIRGNDPAAHGGNPRWLPDARFKEVRKLADLATDFVVPQKHTAMSGEHSEAQEVS